jgi:hypothetical protein
VAPRSRKAALDLPNGRLIVKPPRQRNKRQPAEARAEEVQAEAEPQPVDRPQQAEQLRVHPLRVLLPEQQVVPEPLVDAAADAADAVAALPKPNQSHVSPTNHNTASKPASPISADWPKAFGTYPTS